jgi:hypothetical protein
MAQPHEVLAFLRPEGGYVHYGFDYEGIEFKECKPLSKKEYEAGFAKYDAWKAEQDSAKATAKATAEAKLAALGLTAEDLKALGL